MKAKPKDVLFVSIQFILFVLFAADFDWPLGLSPWFRTVNLIISIIGLSVVVLAILQLNKNISPFPTPKEAAVLIQNGLFKFIRHPIYSGIILMLGGYSFYKDSWYKTAITLLLLLLFHFKTQYEEQQLQNKFKNYNTYKSKTGKFFPKIY
jgi:protein-S-isoprenylcysteine O-methyltransferase Ste14